MVYSKIGKNLVKLWLGSQFPSPPYFMGVGSVGATAANTDTGLGFEMARRTFDSVNTTNDGLVEFEMILPSTVPNSTFNIREIGLFNGSPIGSLYQHASFAAQEKTTDVEVQNIIAIRIE